jgi:hypothetical protein
LSSAGSTTPVSHPFRTRDGAANAPMVPASSDPALSQVDEKEPEAALYCESMLCRARHSKSAKNLIDVAEFEDEFRRLPFPIIHRESPQIQRRMHGWNDGRAKDRVQCGFAPSPPLIPFMGSSRAKREPLPWSACTHMP